MHLIAVLQFAPHALESAPISLLAAWRAFSQFAAALALTAVWQGAAVALGLALCLRLAPRCAARHRFALWGAGFAVLVALEILPFLWHWLPAQALSSAAPLAAPAHPWLQLSSTWGLVIAALWLAASFYRAADLAIHSVKLRQLWRTAEPVQIDPASLPRSIGRLALRPIQICTTRQLERPSVIGFFAPRILIPDWLFPRLTAGELDQIVLHETEHLRRCDDWTNLLQKLCLALFPLNPGLAWIERRLCREREMACDDGVVGITRAPRAYAACLASLAERGLQRRAGALSLGAWQARPELVRRVHSILRCKRALSPAAARTVLGAIACILLAGATALARCPRLVAFAPAHSDAAAHTVGQAAVLNGRHSSAQELATRNELDNSPEATGALKGHDFSRAENGTKSSRALAPEGSTATAMLDASARRGSPRSAAPQSTASPLAALENDSSAFRRALAASPVLDRKSGFVVMSAWESVELTSPESSQKNAAEKTARRDSSVHVAGPDHASATQQILPRITVTRMYLKIYSTGDKESAWLVIQL